MTTIKPSRRAVLSGTVTLVATNLVGTVTTANETKVKDDKIIRLLADHDLQEARFLAALSKFSDVEFTNHPSKDKLESIRDHELAKLDITEGRLAATPAESTVGIAIKLALWRKYSLPYNLTADEINNTTALILSALADAEKQMEIH